MIISIDKPIQSNKQLLYIRITETHIYLNQQVTIAKKQFLNPINSVNRLSTNFSPHGYRF